MRTMNSSGVICLRMYASKDDIPMTLAKHLQMKEQFSELRARTDWLKNGQMPNVTIPLGNTATRISAIDSTLNVFHVESKCVWQLISRDHDRTCAPADVVKDCRQRHDQDAPGAQDATQISAEGVVRIHEIDGIIWSHFRFSHTSDTSMFADGTKLVVGSATRDACMPGYPTDLHAQLLMFRAATNSSPASSISTATPLTAPERLDPPVRFLCQATFCLRRSRSSTCPGRAFESIL